MVCCTSDVCSRRRFPRRHCVACSLSTLKSRSAREDTGDTGPGHLCGGSASPKGLALSFRGRKGRPASGKQSRLGFFSFLNTGFLSGRGGHAAARSCSQGPFPSLLGGGRTLHRLSLAPDRPTGPAARSPSLLLFLILLPPGPAPAVTRQCSLCRPRGPTSGPRSSSGLPVANGVPPPSSLFLQAASQGPTRF